MARLQHGKECATIDTCLLGIHGHRFYIFEDKALPEEGPIRLGWPDDPQGVVDTGYR